MPLATVSRRAARIWRRNAPALDKQIRTTTALIEQAKKEQRVTQEQLQLLESQIEAREQLIHTMNSELHRVEQQILEDEEMVASLKNDLMRLKEEYGRMLQFAYRNRSCVRPDELPLRFE